MKKIISIIITISLLLASVPAFAISGTGTESNPYLISSANDIAKIHDDLNGYYKLTSNINMSGVAFEPIGNENEGAFTGTIDGAGYTISNLNINLAENKYVGFIGYLEGTVKNLNLTNVDAFGYRYVGGLVGYAEKESNVYSCSVNASVSGSIYNNNISLNIGGIAGYNNGSIYNCNTFGNAYSKSYTDNISIGGISGFNNGSINSCENKLTIGLSSDAFSTSASCYMGGITGQNNGDIIDSSNKAYIYGKRFSGGISGKNDALIDNCENYAEVLWGY